MSRVRSNSSPDLLPPPPSSTVNDLAFEGIAVNIKLLLKLVQDHTDAKDTPKEPDAHRNSKRVAAMISILDDVKARIQDSSPAPNKRDAELRRCNTELKSSRPTPTPNPNSNKEPSNTIKTLEALCTALGKEKGVMAAELARKVQELEGMEELVNDLRAQNEGLVAKVKKTCTEKRGIESNGRGQGIQGGGALQERNQELSEQLLKSLDRYRHLKRKLKEVEEKNGAFMKEMRGRASKEVERICGFKQEMGRKRVVDFEEEISFFRWLESEISKHGNGKGEINLTKKEQET